jgi:hypothetical protein
MNWNYYEGAYMYFLEKCIIPEEKLLSRINKNGCYRLLIKTDGDYDKIVCTNGEVFLRSKFLRNPGFKRSLISHYRQIGIFVKGPIEIILDKCWVIEFVRVKSHKYYVSI